MASGRDVETPSRTDGSAGLIRSEENPLTTRFEVRSPSPHTNAYAALASMYQCMLDGIAYAVRSNRTPGELEREFCKEAGEPSEYLLVDRMYRSEEDVFARYTEAERDRLFGKPPASVYETLRCLLSQKEGLQILCLGDVFTNRIISSYQRPCWIRGAGVARASTTQPYPRPAQQDPYAFGVR